MQQELRKRISKSFTFQSSSSSSGGTVSSGDSAIQCQEGNKTYQSVRLIEIDQELLSQRKMKSVDNRGQTYLVQNTKVVIDLSTQNQDIIQVNNLFKEADLRFNKLLNNHLGKSELITEHSQKTKKSQFDSKTRLTPDAF